MADFFFNENEDQDKDKLNRLKNLGSSKYTDLAERADAVLQERQRNRELYGIQVPDAMYELLNESIAASDNPQEEAYRTGTALKYSYAFNIPYSEARDNMDMFTKTWWGEGSKFSAKDEYTRVSDALAIGMNGIKIGVIGNQLMNAQKIGQDEEYIAQLLEKYNALKADNEARQNSTPNKWWKEALEGGAQSLPYTGFAALAGMFGNFIAPVAGGIAAFGTSSFLMAGEEYMEMLDKGIRPEVARPAASVSGMIQGAIEATLGEVASWVGAGAAAAGKKAISKPLQEKLAETLATKLQKKFHFGAASKIAVKEITRYLSDLPEEGAEEGLQSVSSSGVSNAAVSFENALRKKERSAKENEAAAELAAGNITEAVFKDIVAELQNQFEEIPVESWNEIIKNAKEEFRGGVLASIVLGLPAAAGNVYASSRDLHKVKEIMQETPSQELAEKIIKDTVDENGQSLYDKVFTNYSDKEKDDIIDDLFKSQRAIAEKKENLKAKEYAEVNATPEGYKEDQIVKDENGNPVKDEETNETLIKRDPVYRNENGDLETENETVIEKDDTAEKVYKAYDPNTEGNNLLAHIRYNVDEKNNAITITEFNTGNNSGIAQEFYDKWARENAAGYEVTWNAIGENAQQVKEDLINNNPSGINNGLNYYSSVDEVADIKVRTDAIKKIDEAYKAVGKKLNKEQLQSHVSIVEAMFKSLKRHGDIKQNTFNEFINFVFGNEMFGDPSEINYPGVKGKSKVKTIQELEQGLKAAIYVTEKGDYSTFVHEMAHVYRKLVNNEHFEEISKAFNVKQNENGEYTWTRLDEENFATSFEDYLKTGKAANEQQKTIFEKIADFLREAYQGLKSIIQITPEISKVFDEMLDMDDSVIANSQRAADEYERNENNRKTAARQEELRKQQQKQEAQEKEKTKENIDISQEKITANKQDFPLSENEEAEIKNEKFAEEQIENDIREIFDELKPTQEELDELVDKLTSGTQQEKIETAMDAAGEAYDDDYDIPDDEFYQRDEAYFADLENQAFEYLDQNATKENKQLKELLKARKNTPWYDNTLQAITVRRDMDLLEKDLPIREDSLFNANDAPERIKKTCNEYRDACKLGMNELFRWVAYSKSFLGTPEKPVFSFDSSFANCRSSQWCAENCYAANGKYGMADKIIRQEVINRCVEKIKLDRVAEIIAGQYKSTSPWTEDKTPLRIDSVGELTQRYVDLIKVLNDEHKLPTTVFSKRPELLSQLDPKKNIIMLSVDPTNYSLADKYPELPLTIVYTGEDYEIEWISKQKDRFLKHGGVILPARLGSKYLSDEKINKLPKWAYDKYMCEIDGKIKKLAKEALINTKNALGEEHDLSNCHFCYKGNLNGEENRGCFFMRAITNPDVFEKEFGGLSRDELKGGINAEIEILLNGLRERGATEEECRSVLGDLSEIIRGRLAEYDRRKEEGSNGSIGRRNDRKNQVSEKPEEIRLTDENPEELYQLVGELGATNMDRAEEVTTRIDNKNIAVQMEQAGKDAKTIKLATGWEKGVDGKWRYETNDLLNKFDLLNKVLDFEKRNPKYKEYSDKLWASYDGGPELTEAEIQEFDALSDEANAYYDKKDVKLKDILDAPELYTAYPQLKEMDVKFVNDPLNTTRASYATGRDLWTDAEVDFIQINNIPNSINEKEYESVLLHEIQHAIQRIEGFATGGSVQELVQNYKSRIHARMNEAYREYYSNDELKKDYDEYKRLFNKVAEASSDDFMAAYDELFKFEDSHENVRNFNKELEQARKDLHLENNMEAAPLFNGRITDTYYDREYSEIVKKLAEDYYNISAFDDYKALAGEVEARNVQKRMNMSPAERLKTLLSETEDVARDQQIVMYEAVRMAAAEEEQLEQTEVEKQIEAVRKQYKGTDQWMKAPNGEDTNLTEKQWLQIRTPNFLRWFGNWFYNPDKKMKVTELDPSKVTFNYKNTVQVREWLENNLLGENVTVEDNGVTVYFRKKPLRDSIKKKGETQNNAYTVLSKLIEHAVWYDFEENDGQEKHKFLQGQDVYYSLLKVGTDFYSVKIKLNVNKKSLNSVYKDHKVEKIDVAPLYSGSQTEIHIGLDATSDITLGQLTGNVNPNYSVVLDENGEPLVVYHGTKRKLLSKNFEVFNNDKQQWFAATKEYAENYTQERKLLELPSMYELFLNIRNPINVGQINWGGTWTLKDLSKQSGISLNELEAQNFEDKTYIWNVTNDPKFMELAKSKGYDGIFALESGEETYSTFNPNQIKSATENNGNFDENSDNIFYQTEQELMEDAKKYARWEDFMEAYQNDFDPVALEDPLYHSQVPEGADAQWYQTTWELANNIIPEESLNEKEIFDIVSSDTTDAAALDALFTSRMDNNEDMLNEFLLRVAEIVSINLNDEEFSHIADEEEQQQINRIVELQDFISTQLAHGNWVSNAKRLRKGEELTESKRKAILTLMREMPRDYRAIYAEIMDDPKWAVDEKDSVSTKLRERAKLTKYKAASLDTDFERLSPEKRRQIAEQMDDEDIARQVREGTLHLDDRIENYIKNKDKKIREGQKTLENLEKEKNEDYQRIADAQKRELLNLNEKLQLAKLKLEKNNKETKRLIEKGQKISGKYMLNSQNLRADYNEIFRKFSDLKAVIKIDAQVEEAIKRQNMIFATRSELQNEQKQRSLANEVKQMRIQLVKRAMRRVPFNRIDYENARTIIAIQRMLEPNLLGGVNRFIGQDSPFLRGVISGIITDADYKEKIVGYLKKTARASEANREFIEKIENLKTIEQFETWTKKERDYAIKKLPKENWIRDLNLIKLAEEREESIDLDISMKEKQRAAIDEKTGDIKTDKEGNIITETTFELSYSDEIGQLVKDAIGADMFNRLINVPFAEWTEKDLEKLATVINNLYKEGRDLLDAKKALKKLEADRIRMAIEEAVKNTGIVINDDDTPEEKQRKKEKIAKILGYNSAMKGTVENSYNKESNINRILHGYTDANVRRVARILDNYSEGTNTTELYWKENEAYNNKTRSINNRVNAINNVLKENNITIDELNKELKQGDNTFTVDELLYILAADKDFAAKEDKTGSELIDDNDDYAATSRNAVMFGNMLSGTDFLEMKESLYQQDKDLNDRINNDELTEEEQQLLVTGQLITNPGTKQYIEIAHARYENVLAFARNFVKENPKYEALLDVIAADYASQYDRMNQISIEEFNSPVHRVAAYVPLVRLESNGDTNANQVQNDLLATMGGQSKNWVNKGMTQRRVNMSPLNQKPVEMGLYKTWSKSVERTEHFIAYAPYVRELNRVYKSRDAQFTRQFIEGRYGKGMLTYIDDYINEVANPNANKVRNNADAIIRALRGKTAPAYLAWKASSIMKQAATSPWPYMQFVDPVTYLNACFKCMKPGTYEAIRSKSVFMNNRRFDPLADLVDEIGENPKNKFESFMAKQSALGMQGLEWIDWVAVAPGWLACYEKKYAELENKAQARYEAAKARLMEENLYADIGTTEYKTTEQIEAIAKKESEIDTEKEAIDYADDCVRLCQPSNRSVDIAPLFKSSSEFQKAYLQFQTSLNVIWQNIRYDIPYAVRQKEFKQVAGIILGYVFAGIAMNSLMEGATAGDDDDDKDAIETLRKQVYNATTQFTDSVPLLGSAITAANQKIIAGKGGYTTSGEDMTPMVTKFINVVTRSAKAIGETDEEKRNKAWIKAAESFGEGVGMYLGLPVQGTKELLKVAGVGDDDGKLGVKLSEIADNELFNAIDELNPINQ